jgi:SAM-dependent methyltransferase
MPWTGAGWRRFVPQPTVQARPRVKEFVRELPSTARWIDLGAGGRRLRDDVLRVDSAFGESAELVADGHRLPFRDSSLDSVVSTGTLEHVREPATVLGEIRRVLRDGGLVYLEVPFLQGYHADPDDYWRFTQSGLRLLLQQGGFVVRESGAHMGPASGVCWIVSEVIASLFGEGRLHRAGLLLGRCLVWPLKFLDYGIMRLPGSARVASGVFAIGCKASTVSRSQAAGLGEAGRESCLAPDSPVSS